MTDDGRLLTLPYEGVGEARPLVSGEDHPAHLAAWGGFFYWTSKVTGRVRRAAIVDAGAPTVEVVAEGLSSPNAIAVDDLKIVVTTIDGVVEVPLPSVSQ
jgi:hypothetical protein